MPTLTPLPISPKQLSFDLYPNGWKYDLKTVRKFLTLSSDERDQSLLSLRTHGCSCICNEHLSVVLEQKTDTTDTKHFPLVVLADSKPVRAIPRKANPL